MALLNVYGTGTPAGTNGTNEGNLILGQRIRSTEAGDVTAVRFWKTSSDNCSNHVCKLYTDGGTELATATGSGETGGAWNTVPFASPVSIDADTTYVVTCYHDDGDYIFQNNGLSSAITNGTQSIPADGDFGDNGVYTYSSSGFPDDTYQSSEYYIDWVLDNAPGGGGIPPGLLTSRLNRIAHLLRR